MKRTLKITFVIITTVVGVLLILNAYGLFTNVTVSKRTVGPYVLVYDKWIGDYKVTGKVMKTVSSQLKESHQIKCTHSFGVYFDNPQNVPTEKLRSIGGCVVADKTAAQLKIQKLKYNIYQFPQTQGVVSEFPFKGTLSILFGVIKVYPRLTEYLQKHQISAGPVMELYNADAETITYISPIGISHETLETLLKDDDKKQSVR